MAKVAARLMVGRRLADMQLPLVHHNGVAEIAVHEYYSVKSPVFPVQQIPRRGYDSGPGNAFDRRSDGDFDVLWPGICQGATRRGAETAAHGHGVHQRERPRQTASGHRWAKSLWRWVSSWWPRAARPRPCTPSGVPCDEVYKVNEGRPNIVDLIKTGKINLVINTPLGRESFYDEKSIRRAAIRYNIPCITTMSAAQAAVRGIHALLELQREVSCLQDLHRNSVAATGNPSGGD